MKPFLLRFAPAILICGMATAQAVDPIAQMDKAAKDDDQARALRSQAAEIAKTAVNPPCQYLILHVGAYGAIRMTLTIPPGATGEVSVGPICAIIYDRPSADPAALKKIQELQSQATILETEAVILRHEIALMRATESAEHKLQQTAPVLNMPATWLKSQELMPTESIPPESGNLTPKK